MGHRDIEKKIECGREMELLLWSCATVCYSLLSMVTLKEFLNQGILKLRVKRERERRGENGWVHHDKQRDGVTWRLTFVKNNRQWC